MGLLREEQETCITKMATENVWDVYTTDRRYVTKLNKIGAIPYKTDIIYNEEIGWFYKLNENQVLLRQEPKKRILTEEQKQEMGKRLQKARVNSKQEIKTK